MADQAVRPRMADAIQEVFTAEWLRGLANEVSQAMTGVRVEFACRECGQKQIQIAQVKDLAKVVSMTRELIEQAEGKPGTTSVEDAGVTLVVERAWPRAGTQDPVVVPAAP